MSGHTMALFVERVKNWAQRVIIAGGVVQEDGEVEEVGDDSPEWNISDYELDEKYILCEMD